MDTGEKDEAAASRSDADKKEPSASLDDEVLTTFMVSFTLPMSLSQTPALDIVLRSLKSISYSFLRSHQSRCQV